jgi:hypothetical protein
VVGGDPVDHFRSDVRGVRLEFPKQAGPRHGGSIDERRLAHGVGHDDGSLFPLAVFKDPRFVFDLYDFKGLILLEILPDEVSAIGPGDFAGQLDGPGFRLAVFLSGEDERRGVSVALEIL